jgi:hypothetical protein
MMCAVVHLIHHGRIFLKQSACRADLLVLCVYGQKVPLQSEHNNPYLSSREPLCSKFMGFQNDSTWFGPSAPIAVLSPHRLIASFECPPAPRTNKVSYIQYTIADSWNVRAHDTLHNPTQVVGQRMSLSVSSVSSNSGFCDLRPCDLARMFRFLETDIHRFSRTVMYWAPTESRLTRCVERERRHTDLQ